MLLKDYKKAQCMLRLVLGVSDDGEAGKCKALKDTMYRKKFKFFYLHLPTFGYR